MRDHQAVFPTATMCRVLGVSRSGFYAWTQRPPSARTQADARLTAQLCEAHRASDATYGAPRLQAELREAGAAISRKRVARLMRAAGLVGVHRRRGHRTTRPGPDEVAAQDLVQRRFTATAPNQLWVADITYVPTWAGFLYLAVVLDVFSRRVVGWAMAPHLRTDLVLEALAMAVAQRRPAGRCDSPLRSRVSIHGAGLWPAVRRMGRPALPRFGGRLLRQCHGRELLCHARMRAPRPAHPAHACRGPAGPLFLHRGVV